ncbi:MAG: hypothetical protein JJLCMIEE_01981 [Acidimicrobiales bacterium]|nr:hypothetical protein [Acidimicrobiales bacterium]
MPRRRLGVVLLLPPSVSTEIDGLRRACGDPSLGLIAPHVTLVPPVNVREENLAEALGIVRRAGASAVPFLARVGPPDSFAPHSPVLHLPLDDTGGAIARLRASVFTGPLAREVSWPFVPHVTLCDELAEADLVAAKQLLSHYERDIELDALAVLEQRRDAEGLRRWVAVAETPLGAPVTVGRGGFETEITPSRLGGPDVDAFLATELAAGTAGEAAGSGIGTRSETPSGALPLVVVARVEGLVVGCLIGWTAADVARLSAVLVAERERGHGIGGHLLGHFMAAAARRGALHVQGEDLTPQEGALLAARGFEPLHPGTLWRLI